MTNQQANIESWTSQLCAQIAQALAQFSAKHNDQLKMLALDCHPWHGVLALAFLTKSEVDNDPLLDDPREMAAWTNYDFACELSSWKSSSSHLGLIMRQCYESSANPGPVAEEFLRACAKAMNSEQVKSSLSKYRLVSDFRISVTHPDTNVEYCV